ncbi:hypothetical protein [Shimia sp. SDUM112013]|uniref:hypothetical protein n=1 Tax=Shimia sp. SDUM112013 TaxID=3136160 RepID=UPI0032EBF5CB
MTTWPRSKLDYNAIRFGDMNSWNNGTLRPVHPVEHALFLEEVALALCINTDDVLKLISEGKLKRGIFINKGFGSQPHFVSLFNLVEYEVRRSLKKKLAPHHYSKRLIQGFLDDFCDWLAEEEVSNLPKEMKGLLTWIYSVSTNASRGITFWPSFRSKQNDIIFLRAYYEWADFLA